MCGIAGVIFRRNQGASIAGEVKQMLRLQKHRGPDGEGIYEGEGAVLGHGRLAILDLTSAGHQPMSNRRGSLWIVFNGEIYNYRELKTELRGLGHAFNGGSDTEVLLASYEEWGESCVKKLRGMFAFAIWDAETRTLFAARDRVGIKPFHYAEVNGRFYFASEIKAILPFLPLRKPNLRLAQQFLGWNLLDHEPAQTMFEEVAKLPPGHSLTVGEGGKVQLHRYWSLRFSEEVEVSDNEERLLIEEFRARFVESLDLHLRSDVPIGTCLSGGLDSSAIVCGVHQLVHERDDLSGARHKVFSAFFDQPGLNERPYVEEVVKKTGVESHSVYPNGVQLAREMNEWLWHQEEPVGGTGAYAHFCVARLASEHRIKVVLDGQGADEMLAGYRKFIFVFLKQLLKDRCYSQAAGQAMAFFCSPDILRTSCFSDGKRYLFKDLDEVQAIFPKGLGEFPAGFGDSLGKRLHSDVVRFSLPVLLRYEDRNTMAFGIESRVPFVDHELMEFMARLPATLRLSNGWTKRILREALAGVLPEKIARRKTKLGFSTPQSEWLLGPLAGWLVEMIKNSRHLPKVVEPKLFLPLLDLHTRGRSTESVKQMLFRLAVYENWGRLFLEGGNESTRAEPASATVCA